MKKMMIVAAVICAAVVTQAASVTWGSAAGIKGISGTNFAAGLVDKQSYDANGSLVTTSTYQAYGSGTLAYTLALTYDLGTGSVTENFSGTMSKGSGLSTAGKIQSSVTSALFDNKGTSYSYVLVMTDTGTDGKGNGFTATTTISGTSAVQTSGTVSLTTAAPSTWVASVKSTPEPTPEPTSGLLLVLGMAGLALRRRRA